jgi:hypothetical protein
LKALWNVQIAGDAAIHKVIMNICDFSPIEF